MLSSSPRFHARIEHLDAVGLPVVSILIGDGEPWALWANYRRRHQIGAQLSVARHIGLFIDFLGACGHDFMPVESRGKLLQAFADALAMGTITDAGFDPTGLWWLPMSVTEARRTLADVTAFGDWLESEGIAPAINSQRAATLAEQIVFWRRWSYQKRGSLLGHLKTRAQDAHRAMIAREALIRKQSVRSADTTVKAFPEEAIMPLLRDGFSARPRQSHWTTIRDQMIILLLHFGGKRLSEVLHLWIGDVERHPIDPTRCIPWIAHPTEAVVDWRDPKTNVEKRVTRQECLLLRYGIKPLTLRTGARRVGWKNPMTTDTKRMRVFWNDASADRLFWSLYNQYVQLRPRVARHPFLFMTPAGEPMTVQAFEKVHAAAVRRIGLVPAKQLGTTPHGHRHAYGHQAEARQVGTKVMQIALGHKSPYSQEVYKNSDDEVVAKAMTSGEERLSCIMNIRVIVGHK